MPPPALELPKTGMLVLVLSTKMPMPSVETILPLAALLIPPEKLVRNPTLMPDWPAEIVPLLTIPPPAPVLPKTATLWAKMPSPAAVSVPLLLMPPEKLPTLVETSIAALLAEMAPVLLMPPPGRRSRKPRRC
jgi:hypothetical protein